MKKITEYLLVVLTMLSVGGCKKDFLEKKPSSSILSPTSIQELNALLENTNIMNKTAALPQISADEYKIVSEQNYLALPSVTERNAYIWAKDIYEGEVNADWNKLYAQIFYCNNVLKTLNDLQLDLLSDGKKTKGWALFDRAYTYFDLMRNFSSGFQKSTADVVLGVPLRLGPNVDETLQRSSLKETLEQIILDVDEAVGLLEAKVPENNRNRPSKAAAYALKARIGIYIRDYDMAERSADSSLKYHDKIVDYNSISRTSSTPFSYNTAEIIYHSSQIVNYSSLTSYDNLPAIEVNPILIQEYAANDLRKSIFYLVNSQGRYNVKRGYAGGGFYAFTGLACDEIYLIKAECLARRGEKDLSLQFLDRLLINRYLKGSYTSSTASSAENALDMILKERWKELVWRGIRWSDLKRLNMESRNIMLSRQIGQATYTLPANDLRYVFPIPDNEIAMSGIIQNNR
ncbi:RagB/SusD family nutrient uptake outer membrane protein [Pedobacter xixiisoli]|uniref:SusD family protein n=1 Tax=Pedobacter xixiisoli TaxID=1476464 RepID=A0A285ZWA6_9SPHI|nr:RagB/SusD family nutrient uptake outer membrane protein [Pedobacter xixiisoli]SOD13916.1 SusD family protein [Pedobacter xixiisoli]